MSYKDLELNPGFYFEEFTSESIPKWEDIFEEGFIGDGPGGELYQESDEVKDLVDIKVFGKRRPDITTSFNFINTSLNEGVNGDLQDLALTEAIFELQLQPTILSIMNKWVA